MGPLSELPVPPPKDPSPKLHFRVEGVSGRGLTSPLPPNRGTWSMGPLTELPLLAPPSPQDPSPKIHFRVKRVGGRGLITPLPLFPSSP